VIDIEASSSFKAACKKLLTELALIQSDENITVTALTGGVASDIAKVATSNKIYCVKFALAKLKVQAEWFAPVHRNSAEYAWLEVAASVAPASAIKLYGKSDRLHGFAMEYLEHDAYLWKTSLLTEEPDNKEADLVGDVLGRIHAASTETGFNTHSFQNHEDFKALRIEPYLLFTAKQHPDIAGRLEQMAHSLFKAATVLVHGDVSPKNIMIRAGGPVLLDAECATMGDPSFDVAFCVNHLVLKAIHLPSSKARYLANTASLWATYRTSVAWEPVNKLESRICKLLPALMLARVDGKSPVEYLAANEQNTVRQVARELILSPLEKLDALIDRIDQLSALK